MVGEHGGHAREHPRGRCRHIDGVLRVLEVVDIGGVVLRSVALSGNQLGELGVERDVGRLRCMQERNLVEHVGQPLALLLPVQVHTPQRVVQGFGSHSDLRGERLLHEMLERTTHLEVLREVVSPVHSEHRLSRLSVVGVALERCADGRLGIEDALIENGHLARRIIDAIVGALAELDTTRHHMHRTLRHVVGAQGDDVG